MTLRYYRATVTYPRVAHYPPYPPVYVSAEVLEHLDLSGLMVQYGHGEARSIGHVVRWYMEEGRVIAHLQLTSRPRVRGVSLHWDYTYDFEQGEFEGQPYEGIVRTMTANHLALTKTPRLQSGIIEEITALDAMGIADLRISKNDGHPTAPGSRKRGEPYDTIPTAISEWVSL